jgi:hypothetical protein
MLRYLRISLVTMSSASWGLLPISPPDDLSDRRKPAWTDRILHVHSKTVAIEQLSYQSHPGITMSDHRPVSADFIVSVRGMGDGSHLPGNSPLAPPTVRYPEPLRIRDNREEA